MPQPKGVRYGGKPKGYKHKHTLEKAAARELWRQQVTAHLPELIKAHLAHAIGIDHFFLRNSKTKQFEQVTDPKIIQTALNSGDRGSYYWIFTKDPSTQSLQYLIDQALDKAPQSVAVTGGDGGPLEIRWKGEL
jgi:hypothetical protein